MRTSQKERRERLIFEEREEHRQLPSRAIIRSNLNLKRMMKSIGFILASCCCSKSSKAFPNRPTTIAMDQDVVERPNLKNWDIHGTDLCCNQHRTLHRVSEAEFSRYCKAKKTGYATVVYAGGSPISNTGPIPAPRRQIGGYVANPVAAKKMIGLWERVRNLQLTFFRHSVARSLTSMGPNFWPRQ